MNGNGEQAYFKRVALPSGKTIEVLYFGRSGQDGEQSGSPQTAALEADSDAAPRQETSTAPAPSQSEPAPQEEAPAADPGEEATTALHVCDECRSDLVYPADWEEAGRRAWRVTLICPNCGWERRDVFGDEAVEAFDVALDRGIDALARDYKALMRANMADEVERFAAALDADAIQPMDF